MRIGIDARLLHYQRGGISQYILHLIEALAEVDPTDAFAIFQSRRDRVSHCRAQNFGRSSLWTPPHHRLEQWLLPLELAFADLDVLHSPDFIPPLREAPGKFLRRRFKSVITVHDLAFLRYPNLLTEESRQYYSQVAKAVASADGIIAVSDWTRRDLLELTDADDRKIRVIHNAADKRYRPLDPSEAGQAVERFCRERGLPADFILWVGTLEPRKNLDTLLRAMALLQEKEPGRYVLVAVGAKGWLFESALQLLDQLRLKDYVLFRGPASVDELLMLYNAASMFVFPSLYEGFGLPPLEAMACGAPVISSNAACLPEVLGDAAIFVDPLDVEGWARAIRRLSTDDAQRRDMARRGLERAASYEWNRTAEQTLSLYRRVAGQ
ncbi:MAG: glycosyltransferase family 4 protein [Chloroflexi bacterium]|nr:glycosyltransferase family 4 protein [Chloroflexota bacterium]